MFTRQKENINDLIMINVYIYMTEHIKMLSCVFIVYPPKYV